MRVFTADEPMQFRIGVHVGDVMVDGENLLGDGVNIAARLEALAEPGAICISAVVHDQIGNRLPVAFDDLGEQKVKNIAQTIRVYRVQLERPPARPVASPPLSDKPSIAVLPFQNMSGDPEQEYFADRMVEEIITALSRIRWLFVIARNSSFTYKGQAVDIKRVGRELGVRYVLEGSVRKARNQVRITGQLIDAGNGAHLWADRFDGPLEDIFELQDQVTASVVGAIAPRVEQVEIYRASINPRTILTRTTTSPGCGRSSCRIRWRQRGGQRGAATVLSRNRSRPRICLGIWHGGMVLCIEQELRLVESMTLRKPRNWNGSRGKRRAWQRRMRSRSIPAGSR